MLDKVEPASPGDLIRRELEKRGWRQRDLAYVLGIQEQAVTMLACGKRGVSAEMAKSLGQAFGIPAETILALQKASEVQVELARAKEPKPDVVRRASLISSFPVRMMLRRKWISEDATDLASEVTKFLEIENIGDTPKLSFFAKKANYHELPPEQITWVFRVRQIAQRLITPAYSESKLRGEIGRIRSLMTKPEDAGSVPRILADCGVRFVIVEGLPGSDIDGVCFWINGGTCPVVGMSMRFDRIDNFWFVLRHELEHVLRGHGVEGIMLDRNLGIESTESSDELPEEEQQANAASSDFCVPKTKMESWIARKSPFFSEADLLGFSKLQNVHPGIVAGQLRHRLKKYSLFTPWLAKVRHAVVATAVVDGWGEIYPTT